MPVRRRSKPIIECHIELREIKTNDTRVYLSNKVKYDTGGRRRDTDQRNIIEVSKSVPTKKYFYIKIEIK
jgi:hypothetical protein